MVAQSALDVMIAPSAPNMEEMDSFQYLDLLFTHLGSKWIIKIIGILLTQGECRYTRIQKKLPGISKKVLSGSLQSLERNGLVIRLVQMGYPPKVSYRLSERGNSLTATLMPLADWGKNNLPMMHKDSEDFEERLQKKAERNPWHTTFAL